LGLLVWGKLLKGRGKGVASQAKAPLVRVWVGHLGTHGKW